VTLGTKTALLELHIIESDLCGFSAMSWIVTDRVAHSVKKNGVTPAET
jgi:hypothetical protein